MGFPNVESIPGFWWPESARFGRGQKPPPLLMNRLVDETLGSTLGSFYSPRMVLLWVPFLDLSRRDQPPFPTLESQVAIAFFRHCCDRFLGSSVWEKSEEKNHGAQLAIQVSPCVFPVSESAREDGMYLSRPWLRGGAGDLGAGVRWLGESHVRFWGGATSSCWVPRFVGRRILVGWLVVQVLFLFHLRIVAPWKKYNMSCSDKVPLFLSPAAPR